MDLLLKGPVLMYFMKKMENYLHHQQEIFYRHNKSHCIGNM